jgi:carboxyvinyl-carboxyphosphonate phosphorylmutase
MRTASPREQFRALLASEQCVAPGSVFDPISARIALDLGFEVGMFAGSIASMTVLGAPDLIVLTLSEFADQARRICRAAPIPLLVDADHGYGNALNVMRTVEELENAGVAALSIEDTRLPQAYGQAEPALISLDEGVGKMRAALLARQDPGLVIAGRTSAPAIAGIEEAIARCRAYEAAGVDALFVVGLATLADLEALSAAVRVPNILGGGKELKDLGVLARHRVRVALQGHQPFMAAVQAVHDTLKALREGVPPAELQGVASAALIKQVTRDDSHQRWLADFLGTPPPQKPPEPAQAKR